MRLDIEDKMYKKLLATAKKAYKHLHKKGSYKPEDLAQENPLSDFVNETDSILQSAIKDNVIPDAMLRSLKEDVFVFSGLKTHAQLAEASRLLLTDDGKRKSFAQFSKDVEGIIQNYNQTYLQAEYQFATGSAQMAARWASFSDDTERYYLQYRTAQDGRVRDAHAQLHEITLPKDDPFWDSYGAKNGWNCRCLNVEVRAGKYQKSDSDKANALGKAATTALDKDGNNKLAIFRYNPGKQQVIFPPAHPYHKVAGAKQAISAIKGEPELSDKAKQNREVYKKSVEEQYSNIYKHKSGGKVFIHDLVNIKSEDHPEIMRAAKEFAAKGRKVWLLPEIEASEKEARSKLLKGLQSERSNPDMKADNEYVDLKRPSAIKNITGNANQAAKQGAIALISDVRMNITDEQLAARAKAILSEKNKAFYPYDKIYFLHDGTVKEYNSR